METLKMKYLSKLVERSVRNQGGQPMVGNWCLGIKDRAGAWDPRSAFWSTGSRIIKPSGGGGGSVALTSPASQFLKVTSFQNSTSFLPQSFTVVSSYSSQRSWVIPCLNLWSVCMHLCQSLSMMSASAAPSGQVWMETRIKRKQK